MVAMWSLVAYTKYFNWNCVEVALAYNNLLFSGALNGMFVFTIVSLHCKY